MIHYWPFMGLREQPPGATDDPDLPAKMQISTDLPPRLLRTAPGAAVSDPATATATAAHARALAAPPAELSDEGAGRRGPGGGGAWGQPGGRAWFGGARPGARGRPAIPDRRNASRRGPAAAA